MLLIDIGNSRLKWQLRGNTRAQGWDALPTIASLASFLWCWRQALVKPRLRPSCNSALAASWFGLAHLGWICLFYPLLQNPERLGVDRWLAILGTRRHCAEAVLVVDAGTALTADLPASTTTTKAVLFCLG